MIAFGNLFGKILFLDLLLKILKWPSFLFGDVEGVPLHALGVLNKKRFQFPKSNARAIEELRHLSAAHDREITTKQDPVKTGKHAVDTIRICIDKRLHDSIPCSHRPRIGP